MELYIHEYECCGCEACYNVCPVNAIEMKPNSMGELFPNVNDDYCIKCGKCIKVCDFKKGSTGFTPIAAYGAATKNSIQYKKSTSGGIFAMLADAIIEQDGVVIGATLEYNDNKLEVFHKMIKDKTLIASLQGSKYVQSRIGSVFSEIGTILNKGKLVLFCGTPCQVAGLKNFLGKDYDYLYTIDIVCHGVPSMDFFRNHIHYIETSKSIRINNIEFRKKGARHSGIDIRYSYFDQGEKRHIDMWPVLDSYYQLFLDGQTYRESCYSCKYANVVRQGDFSICDFWGADKEISEDFLKKENITLSDGFSGVLVNTAKGKAMLEKLTDKMHYIRVEPEQIIKWNAQLNQPSKKGDLWEEIKSKYVEGQRDFEQWYLKKYAKQIIRYKALQLVRKILPREVRLGIKKVLGIK